MTSLAQTVSAPNFDGLRLGKKTVEALEAMAWQGIPLHEAAKTVEMRRGNLERAFNLLPVRQRYNQLTQYIRQNEGQAAIARIGELARSAKSEHVRLEANQWLAGVQGVAPVSRVHGIYQHSHSFGGFEYDDDDPSEDDEIIDGTVAEDDIGQTAEGTVYTDED
ncbi:hypothetical protein [uncultured Ruegeria sp.]|uniref:hypothetical protein n=1 Tax=uncultured Ruegeria sp. TaxID=259304 RepID=UPI00261918FC|nr:hypothetical protein [uncultured Ruegeria sp.]